MVVDGIIYGGVGLGTVGIFLAPTIADATGLGELAPYAQLSAFAAVVGLLLWKVVHHEPKQQESHRQQLKEMQDSHRQQVSEIIGANHAEMETVCVEHRETGEKICIKLDRVDNTIRAMGDKQTALLQSHLKLMEGHA